jgi:ATP-dependent DNA helicase RecG
MKLLEDTTTPDGRLVCENRGSGIGAMLAALRRVGLPGPRFVDRVSTFEVTFQAVEPIEDTVPQARQRRDRRDEIVKLLHQRGELGRAEIAAALGLGDKAAQKWLRILRDEQLVELTTSARSRNARYRARTRGAT